MITKTERTIDLAAIEARAKSAAPGPWWWGGNTDVRRIRLSCHVPGLGMCEVMDFARWGMQEAKPRFINSMEKGGRWMVDADALAIYQVAPDATSRDDARVYRGDIIGIRHPDAEFIAHARQDIDDLLTLVRDLKADLEEVKGS